MTSHDPTAAKIENHREGDIAKQIQKATGVPEVGMLAGIHPLENQPQEGGSTDVADISWVAPTLHVTVATA